MDLLSCWFIFSPMKKNEEFTNVFTRNISKLAALKLVMSTPKETSQILLQTLWHLWKPQLKENGRLGVVFYMES